MVKRERSDALDAVWNVHFGELVTIGADTAWQLSEAGREGDALQLAAAGERVFPQLRDVVRQGDFGERRRVERTSCYLRQRRRERYTRQSGVPESLIADALQGIGQVDRRQVATVLEGVVRDFRHVVRKSQVSQMGLILERIIAHLSEGRGQDDVPERAGVDVVVRSREGARAEVLQALGEDGLDNVGSLKSVIADELQRRGERHGRPVAALKSGVLYGGDGVRQLKRADVGQAECLRADGGHGVSLSLVRHGGGDVERRTLVGGRPLDHGDRRAVGVDCVIQVDGELPLAHGREVVSLRPQPEQREAERQEVMLLHT